MSVEKWPVVDEKKINPELDHIDDFIQTIVSDVKDILKLAKIEKPQKITVIVANSWKHDFYKAVEKELQKTRNVGEVMKSIMSTSLKQHGQEIQKILPKLVQHGVINLLLDSTKEAKVLQDSKELFEKEFNCKLEIVKEKDSKEPKAKQAMPGKPALVVA